MSNTVGSLPDPDDPYNMASGPTYSVDKFYVRASDGKGHSMNVQVPLSTSTYGIITGLLAGKDFPAYKTIQDFIRDAVIHRARYLTEAQRKGRYSDILAANPGMQAMIERDQIMAAMDAIIRERDQVEATFRSIEQGTSKLLDAGLIREALQRLDEWERISEVWHPLDAARLDELVATLRSRARARRAAEN